jgi:ABC-type uncharacterized transport system substrate-binding protein
MATRLAAIALTAGMAMMGAVAPASAHPHVWVDVNAELVFSQGKVVGVRHAWTFDDMYSAFVTQGVGKNPSAPTPAELQPLAKSNVENLKEFEYFTFMKTEGAQTVFGDPTDYSMAQDAKKQVTLKFTLPLKAPAALDDTFKFQVFDPNYFVAFTLEKEAAVRLVGAPAGCAHKMIAPETLSEADIKTLEESAASGQAPGVDFGMKMAGYLVIKCR